MEKVLLDLESYSLPELSILGKAIKEEKIRRGVGEEVDRRLEKNVDGKIQT